MLDVSHSLLILNRKIRLSCNGNATVSSQKRKISCIPKEILRGIANYGGGLI